MKRKSNPVKKPRMRGTFRTIIPSAKRRKKMEFANNTAAKVPPDNTLYYSESLEKRKQYIYVVQALLEPSKCKIGKTVDLERRLKEYNNMTGKSKDNKYQFLFSCEVKNMASVENDLKNKFTTLREERNREIYFFNKDLFKDYVNFIKAHNSFIQEIFIREPDGKKVKIVKKTTPSLKERGISQKDLLQKAQKANNDEFYTRYEDIEKELSMYDKTVWKNKVVFCNCDDAVGENEKNTSAFALYFIKNFSQLGLEKLICTHYGGAVDLFNQGAKGYVFTKTGFKEFDRQYPKNYTGSFDDPISIKILDEEADIVCTNPPFSRAVDFWKLLVKSGKKFIIVSNITNPITASFIPFFFQNKVWAGYNRIDHYLNPKKELVEAAGHWYTNFHIRNRPKYEHLKMIPLEEIPNQHKSYDDSNTLLVDQGYIPNNYDEPFAVSARPILNGILEMGYKLIEHKEYYPYVDGKKKFARVLIRNDRFL